jgi:hypothetical protein
MAVQTTAMKNALAAAYAAKATHLALYSTVPGAAAGTELTGGSYARKATSWSAPSNGTISGSATFDVPSGATVAGYGFHDALTAGNYLDGFTVTSQTFNSAGQLVVNYTATAA